MRGFRLFERPLSVFSSQPALYIQGSLPDYTPGEEYEGRLPFFNSVGRCHVEIVEEESQLPPGASAHVDNFNKQIVLVFPAYVPPEVEKLGVINGDFQAQTLEGWVDLRGNSWGVEESTVYNAAWATPGDYVAAMRGSGRGEHTLESIKYPVTAQQSLWARSLWDQGPSNKDNNNLWTALQFYTPGGIAYGEEIRGDRIHDRTNKSRHHSTVTATAPIDGFVTIRLIAGRRNSRNRVILVDNVEATGLVYSVGVDTEEDYYVKLKLTDSANQVAYWEGPLFWNSNVFTSLLYPVVHEESVSGTGAFLSAQDMGENRDNVYGVGVLAELILEESVRYFTSQSTDAAAGMGELVSASLVASMQYLTASVGDPVTGRGDLESVSLTVTVAYVNYIAPPENVFGSGALQGVTLT